MQILEINDLMRLARRRVPRMFFDYADSGAYTEGTYRRNERDFESIELRQRVGRERLGRSDRGIPIGQDLLGFGCDPLRLRFVFLRIGRSKRRRARRYRGAARTAGSRRTLLFATRQQGDGR